MKTCHESTTVKDTVGYGKAAFTYVLHYVQYYVQYYAQYSVLTFHRHRLPALR